MPSTTVRSCTPTSTNDSPSSTNTSQSQSWRACSRAPEEIALQWRVISTPQASTASTPETWARSAPSQATYGSSSLTVFSTGASDTPRRIRLPTQPTASPTVVPPTAATTSSTPAWTSEKAPDTVTATATRYRTRAVASLSSPSPSRMVTIRLGSPSRPATAVAATGSGGYTNAPTTT